MAGPATLTPAEERAAEVAEMKVEAKEKRGVGIVRVNAYLQGEDRARGDDVVPTEVIVSISDYFEDEVITVVAEAKESVREKATKENKGCRIAKSELATASKVLTFPYTGPTKITITHGQNSRVVALDEKNRRAYFVMGENES